MDITKIEAKISSLATEKVALQKTIETLSVKIKELEDKQRAALARMRLIISQEQAIEELTK